MNPDLLFFCPLCREKSPKERAKLSCEMEHSVKTYSRGEHIAFQGDRIFHLYILTRGRVRTEIVSDSGLTLSVEELEAPYPLAAAFLFADDNRFPVDVTALKDCEVILISKKAVERQMAACPGFLHGFMAFNANRMQFLSERLKIFSQKGIRAKLAYYILKHDRQGNFCLGKSIASLAEYFGVERPSLSRCLSEMVQQGIIEYEAGKGKILNYKMIQEILG